MAREEILARVPVFAKCTADEVKAIAGAAQEGCKGPIRSS